MAQLSPTPWTTRRTGEKASRKLHRLQHRLCRCMGSHPGSSRRSRREGEAAQGLRRLRWLVDGMDVGHDRSIRLSASEISTTMASWSRHLTCPLTRTSSAHRDSTGMPVQLEGQLRYEQLVIAASHRWRSGCPAAARCSSLWVRCSRSLSVDLALPGRSTCPRLVPRRSWGSARGSRTRERYLLAQPAARATSSSCLAGLAGQTPLSRRHCHSTPLSAGASGSSLTVATCSKPSLAGTRPLTRFASS